MKDDFSKIDLVKIETDNLLRDYARTMEKLRKLYVEYSKKNKRSDIVLTLDSFNMQVRFVEIEYNNFREIYKLFLRRLYGDYYKFYRYVLSIIELPEYKPRYQLEVYKDLTVKDYDYECVSHVQFEIMEIIKLLRLQLTTSSGNLRPHIVRKRWGLNVGNYVNLRSYNNKVMDEKIHLIENCLQGYSLMQYNFLERLHSKIMFAYDHLRQDVRVTDTFEIDKKKSKSKVGILLMTGIGFFMNYYLFKCYV
jgi:hypothetical protein